MLILLDYGHGGTDPGAVYKGRREAEDVLRIGQAVAKRLRAVGVAVDETRTTNKMVSLEQRVKMEWMKPYDFFLSFHRNAFKPEQATGAEVFVYRFTNKKSKPLADQIQRAFVQVGFRNRGVKEADFYVLKHTRAPALLLEIGFIDNRTDNELFDAKFEAIVEGIVEAILEVSGGKEENLSCPACGQRVSL